MMRPRKTAKKSIYNKRRPFVKVKLTKGETGLGELMHHVFIYQPYDKWQLHYRAFCAGSIITTERVLTSAHCFVTNRKRRIRNFNRVRIVGGILHTLAQEPIADDVQQWRSLEHLYTQRFHRFPAYNLAVLQVNKPWVFNQFVNKIPYASMNQDFDGVCIGTAVRTTKSWSTSKYLYKVKFRIIQRRSCEYKMLRSCALYYCTEYDVLKSSSDEIEGGGLVCYGTGDPEEDEDLGLLVGVTGLINIGLPSFNNRVGLFHKWVTDDCNCIGDKFKMYLLLVVLVLVV